MLVGHGWTNTIPSPQILMCFISYTDVSLAVTMPARSNAIYTISVLYVSLQNISFIFREIFQIDESSLLLNECLEVFIIS